MRYILSSMSSLKSSRMVFEMAKPLSYVDLEPLKSELEKAKRKPGIQRQEKLFLSRTMALQSSEPERN